MKLKLLPRNLTNEMIDAWSDVEPRAPAWDWRVMYDAASNDATERLIAVLKEARGALEEYSQKFIDHNTHAAIERIDTLITEIGE